MWTILDSDQKLYYFACHTDGQRKEWVELLHTSTLLLNPQTKGEGMEIGGRRTFRAIENRKYDLVHCYLRMGIDPSFRLSDRNNNSLISIAAYQNSLDIVKLLISYKANINATDDSRSTPLHYACTAKNHKVMEALLNAHADRTITDYTGQTPLHQSCAQGDPKGIKLFLSDPTHLNDKTALHGDSPFHLLAVSSAPTSVIKTCIDMLVKYGCNLNAFDNNGETALGLTLRQGNLERALLFYQSGSSLKYSFDETEDTPHITPSPSSFSEGNHISLSDDGKPSTLVFSDPTFGKGQQFETIFHTLARMGDRLDMTEDTFSAFVSLVEGGIKEGIDPNTREPKHGYTPLHLSIILDCSIRVISVFCSICDVTISDNSGVLPLTLALHRDSSKQISSVLISHNRANQHDSIPFSPALIHTDFLPYLYPNIITQTCPFHPSVTLNPQTPTIELVPFSSHSSRHSFLLHPSSVPVLVETSDHIVHSIDINTGRTTQTVFLPHFNTSFPYDQPPTAPHPPNPRPRSINTSLLVHKTRLKDTSPGNVGNPFSKSSSLSPSISLLTAPPRHHIWHVSSKNGITILNSHTLIPVQSFPPLFMDPLMKGVQNANKQKTNHVNTTSKPFLVEQQFRTESTDDPQEPSLTHLIVHPSGSCVEYEVTSTSRKVLQRQKEVTLPLTGILTALSTPFFTPYIPLPSKQTIPYPKTVDPPSAKPQTSQPLSQSGSNTLPNTIGNASPLSLSSNFKPTASTVTLKITDAMAHPTHSLATSSNPFSTSQSLDNPTSSFRVTYMDGSDQKKKTEAAPHQLFQLEIPGMSGASPFAGFSQHQLLNSSTFDLTQSTIPVDSTSEPGTPVSHNSLGVSPNGQNAQDTVSVDDGESLDVSQTAAKAPVPPPPIPPPPISSPTYKSTTTTQPKSHISPFSLSNFTMWSYHLKQYAPHAYAPLPAQLPHEKETEHNVMLPAHHVVALFHSEEALFTTNPLSVPPIFSDVCALVEPYFTIQTANWFASESLLGLVVPTMEKNFLIPLVQLKAREKKRVVYIDTPPTTNHSHPLSILSSNSAGQSFSPESHFSASVPTESDSDEEEHSFSEDSADSTNSEVFRRNPSRTHTRSQALPSSVRNHQKLEREKKPTIPSSCTFVPPPSQLLRSYLSYLHETELLKTATGNSTISLLPPPAGTVWMGMSDGSVIVIDVQSGTTRQELFFKRTKEEKALDQSISATLFVPSFEDITDKKGTKHQVMDGGTVWLATPTFGIRIVDAVGFTLLATITVPAVQNILELRLVEEKDGTVVVFGMCRHGESFVIDPVTRQIIRSSLMTLLHSSFT